MDIHATIPVTQSPNPSTAPGMDSVGWHRDRDDAATIRYWDGARFTATRRWSGHDWVDAAAPSTASPAGPSVGAQAAAGLETAAATVRSLADSLPTAGLTFKVLVGAAAAMVLGYFVPVATISAGSGATEVMETRTLGDIGGFGVLVLAAAAATVWLAWPARNRDRLSIPALAGLGASAVVVGFFVLVVTASMGTTETDYGYGMVSSSTAEPSIGVFVLALAILAQGAGIALAVLDRFRGEA